MQAKPMSNSWKEINQTINKDYVFSNFKEALVFVNAVGALAEQAKHHPDIRLFDYKKVQISLTTHSEGKVTEKDRALANQIDEIL